MSSSNPIQQTTRTDQTSPALIPADLLVSLAAGPILLGVCSMQAVSSSLESLGIASEEVFRGDRLPILPFPESTPEELEDSKT
ncbi:MULTISPECIES: hypothetical protein [unclassified Coleofasciculus]|uniref:hypothetical protein n=1 Tax=unclassified Coleofasciculus TaxID=2692782 RepID=UPI00187F567D|nr:MULTISPECIES: hypothetical protein [unclassified Coleofasciculus]MBE9128736.1 hypothetical protein [Coleofasciculus sp. LEGE 07081]MBE9151814.1 hypothetical protein [Coleofasciculus sp. LEGE 07092]